MEEDEETIRGKKLRIEIKNKLESLKEKFHQAKMMYVFTGLYKMTD